MFQLARLDPSCVDRTACTLAASLSADSPGRRVAVAGQAARAVRHGLLTPTEVLRAQAAADPDCAMQRLGGCFAARVADLFGPLPTLPERWASRAGSLWSAIGLHADTVAELGQWLMALVSCGAVTPHRAQQGIRDGLFGVMDAAATGWRALVVDAVQATESALGMSSGTGMLHIVPGCLAWEGSGDDVVAVGNVDTLITTCDWLEGLPNNEAAIVRGALAAVDKTLHWCSVVGGDDAFEAYGAMGLFDSINYYLQDETGNWQDMTEETLQHLEAEFGVRREIALEAYKRLRHPPECRHFDDQTGLTAAEGMNQAREHVNTPRARRVLDVCARIVRLRPVFRARQVCSAESDNTFHPMFHFVASDDDLALGAISDYLDMEYQSGFEAMTLMGVDDARHYARLVQSAVNDAVVVSVLGEAMRET
jgi:hypothetical protein